MLVEFEHRAGDIEYGDLPDASNAPKENAMTVVNTQDSMLGDLLKIILAIILPPLGVFLEVGIGKHFWINIILTLLGFIPGIIHAVYIIASR